MRGGSARRMLIFRFILKYFKSNILLSISPKLSFSTVVAFQPSNALRKCKTVAYFTYSFMNSLYEISIVDLTSVIIFSNCIKLINIIMYFFQPSNASKKCKTVASTCFSFLTNPDPSESIQRETAVRISGIVTSDHSWKIWSRIWMLAWMTRGWRRLCIMICKYIFKVLMKIKKMLTYC